jgi:hypothetical protein
MYRSIYLENSIIIVQYLNEGNTTSGGPIAHFQPHVVPPRENILSLTVISKEPIAFGDVGSRRTLDTGGTGLAARRSISSHLASGTR